MIDVEELKKIDFVPLNTHSHFSIPFGVGKPSALLKKAIKMGHKGFCLTDINSMAGVFPLIKASKDEKFPIMFGAELNIIDSLENRNTSARYFNIVCYVKNNTGYKNLVRLISNSSKKDHFYYKPRISLSELIEYKDGLIITSGNMYGLIGQSILKESGQEEILVQIFKEHWEDDFYFQLNYHPKNMEFDYKANKHVELGFDPQKIVNLKLLELAKKYNVKYFITQNAFMPDKKNKVQQNILIGNDDQYKHSKFQEYHTYDLKSVDYMYNEIQEMSPYIDDETFISACKTSVEIFDKCKNVKLKFKPQLPEIKYAEHIVNTDSKWDEVFYDTMKDVKEVSTTLYEMMEIAHDRDIALKTTLKIILKNNKINFNNKIYADRLAYELKVIQRNGVIKLLDYFLLLEKVTHFVRENGFLRGFGRGSGAGSLLAYALDITDCDPILYGLLFERFLTQDRIGQFLYEDDEFKYNSVDDVRLEDALQ